jgi:hypothetical protein
MFVPILQAMAFLRKQVKAAASALLTSYCKLSPVTFVTHLELFAGSWLLASIRIMNNFLSMNESLACSHQEASQASHLFCC